MIFKKIINITTICIFIGCNSNPASSNTNQTCGKVTIFIQESNFYFNLINELETNANSDWHLLIESKDVEFCGISAPMPNVKFRDNLLIAMYENINYENLIQLPEDFEESALLFDNTSVEFSNENEIISYSGYYDNCETHDVNLNTSVFIIKELNENIYFKLQFIEYDNWTICINYEML